MQFESRLRTNYQENYLNWTFLTHHLVYINIHFFVAMSSSTQILLRKKMYVTDGELPPLLYKNKTLVYKMS